MGWNNIEKEVIRLTNVERTRRGIRSLNTNSKLHRAAKKHSKYMMRHRYLGHSGPNGNGPSDRAHSEGYSRYVGENAFHYPHGRRRSDRRTAQLLVEGWMNSPGHRANILNRKYTDIGVAVVRRLPRGRTYYATQVFGMGEWYGSQPASGRRRRRRRPRNRKTRKLLTFVALTIILALIALVIFGDEEIRPSIINKLGSPFSFPSEDVVLVVQPSVPRSSTPVPRLVQPTTVPPLHSESIVTVSPVSVSPESLTRPPTLKPAAAGARTAVLAPSPISTQAAGSVEPTKAATVAPTSNPMEIPSPTPTATPVPAKLLALEANATVGDYWSDGTANVELELSLRNDGSRAFPVSQTISVFCRHDDDKMEDCASAQMSLADGFGPATEIVILRVPMGLVKLEIDYGGVTPSTLQVSVPERIWGVEKEIWECYSDRIPIPSDSDKPDYGCYGWYSETVAKWRSDSTVRVWATGKDGYIRAFRETMDEQLAPVLNLDFEWVDEESDADFVAHLGISNTDEIDDRWKNCLDAWGCGGVVEIENGEVTKGDFVVFHIVPHDVYLDDYPTLKRILNGVFIHEALHALAPTGHAVREKVVLSVMRSANYLTYIDRGILRLNSDPLIEPGMTMTEIEPLIVFRDQLLDNPKEEPDAYDMLEYALAALQRVDTARMEVRGGWTGGGCDDKFGEREWAILEIGRFDHPDDPLLAHLKDGADSFFIFYSDEAAATDGDGWRHWRKTGDTWNNVSREELWRSTAWWVRNSKLHHTIAEILWYYDSNDIQIMDQSDGEITLSASYNPTDLSDSQRKGETLSFTLVIDENTYQARTYEWTYRNLSGDYCPTYIEEGRAIEYGVEIEIPSYVVQNSEFAVPSVSK
ncbi:MAG: CAP domain-containing protein [Dehalococcoidia bacterium]|nr:CAP domain-containing protein [Dehalococcoidia bacterium]